MRKGDQQLKFTMMEIFNTMHKITINHYLQQDNHLLSSLLFQIQQRNEWNKILNLTLENEPELKGHYHITNIIQNTLIILAENPHWVTRLRFLTPELLPKLQKHTVFKNIIAIQCKTCPIYTIANKKNKRLPQRKLSIATADSIREIANKIQYEKLKVILEKIAKRIK